MSKGQRPRMAGGRLACLVALGALASLGGATAAGATVPDPQTTNVPYVAWRGEQLKLVKCGLPAGADRADYLVEEWSGSSQRDPQIEPSSVSVSGGCARGDVVSLTDGLARVKLIAYNGSTAVDKHQFLAIWLSLGTPTVREVADPGNTLAGTKAELGDPSGDGNFNPGSKPGRLEVELTGSFPHPLGPAGRFTLPSDWAALANALATDTLDGNPANDAMRWDVPFGTPTSGGSTSPNGPFVPGSNGLPTPIAHTTGSVYGAVYGAGSHAPADLRQAAKHAHKASKKAYVRSARVVRLKGGKRVLVVHVRSSKVKARIAVKMYGKHKHVMKRATRTVRTNRNVRVKHLAIGKSVRTIRVAIVR